VPAVQLTNTDDLPIQITYIPCLRASGAIKIIVGRTVIYRFLCNMTGVIQKHRQRRNIQFVIPLPTAAPNGNVAELVGHIEV